MPSATNDKWFKIASIPEEFYTQTNGRIFTLEYVKETSFLNFYDMPKVNNANVGKLGLNKAAFEKFYFEKKAKASPNSMMLSSDQVWNVIKNIEKSVIPVNELKKLQLTANDIIKVRKLSQEEYEP